MGKTIKDLAVEDAKYWCSTPGSEGTKEELVTIGYMRGANAVLDELKTRLKEYKTNSLGEYFVAWDYINEIINELKGE